MTATRPALLGSRRRWPLLAGMLLAIALVAGLGWWDAQREDEAALSDLGTEQSVLASAVAGFLRARLAAGERDGARLASDALQGGPAEGLMVLVSPPGAIALVAGDGRAVPDPVLRDALDRGQRVVRLSRPEAAALGLAPRTAMAGLAYVDAAVGGRWGVVAVASAARQRDRYSRARLRLVLGVLVAAGLVLGFGGVALANQRKELEAEREVAVADAQRERDQQLLRAQRVATMGTFAMGVAHEVATPLGVIVGRTEQLLERLKDDERGARSAETILKQADRIQLTIRRFLDLARGQAPAFERADPADLVRSAASSVEHRFAKARVSLKTDVATGMPPVRCDRALVEHAIANLLLNACEACESGGHVEAAAREDAERVAFVVTDDGAGISPEHAARAAEPFFTTKPAGSGTGLGLAIASEIAKTHGGELTIAAARPRGTRASIEIPIATERSTAR